jgi:HEPN domain-containing protein
MTSEQNFENWLRLANRDLDLAEIVYNAGQWLTVAYFCQQALEKLSKGLYIIYINDDFPYLHNIKEILIRFEPYLPVPIPEHIYDFVKELSVYYIKGRYATYKQKLSLAMNKKKITNILSTTKEVFSWLLTLKK